MIKSIGIIGYGQFGQFMYGHLRKHFDVLVYDQDHTLATDSPVATLKEVCKCDLVVFAVPMQALEEACKESQKLIKESIYIIDVTSVKIKPLITLQKYFPSNRILGTHPIFGPNSAKDGIAGLPIVLSNISFSIEECDAAKKFLTETLKLNVFKRTALEHDKEMADIMGISHFIGRALSNLHIKDYETNTKTYHHLVELTGIISNDSWQLFETIQNENSYAKEKRKEFLQELNNLEEKLR